jgi:CubicO group peptidase (beta-lactamase class C family)
VVLVACASLLVASAAFSTPSSTLEAELVSRIESGMDRFGVPAASVAVIVDGLVSWTRDFGAESVDQPTFQVASLSKPVTALGVLRLVEEGRLDLDRPVFDYLTRWSLPAGDWDPQQITARRLLGHTSGLGIHGYPGFRPVDRLPDLVESLDGETAGAGAVRLEAAPGSRVRYSSGGYTVLQLLIEEITGEAFEDWIRREILIPAGMTASDFDPDTLDPVGAPGSRILVGHGWWGDDLPLYRFRARAASGLYSTAGDLARFLTVLWNPQQLGLTGDVVEVVSSSAEGSRARFGQGFALDGLGPRRILLHTGANRGWRSVLAVEPESRDGVVFLTNSDRGLALTTEVLCWWGERISGFESASCWAARKSSGTVLLVTGLLGLVIGWEFLGIAFRRRAERRLGPRPERYPWMRWVRLIFSLVALIFWWVFWYSDTIVVRRDGIENFIPVATVPPTFIWLSLVVSVWCLIGIGRFFLRRTPRLDELTQDSA